MRLHEKLALHLKRRGWSAGDLARMAGCPRASAYRWVSGEAFPGLREGLLLSKALGVDLTYLADDSLDEYPATNELSEDESLILRTVKALGLEADEVIRRLATDPRLHSLTDRQGDTERAVERDRQRTAGNVAFYGRIRRNIELMDAEAGAPAVAPKTADEAAPNEPEPQRKPNPEGRTIAVRVLPPLEPPKQYPPRKKPTEPKPPAGEYPGVGRRRILPEVDQPEPDPKKK